MNSKLALVDEMKGRYDQKTRELPVDMTVGELADILKIINNKEEYIGDLHRKISLAIRALEKITMNSVDDYSIALCRLAVEEITST